MAVGGGCCRKLVPIQRRGGVAAGESSPVRRQRRRPEPSSVQHTVRRPIVRHDAGLICCLICLGLNIILLEKESRSLRCFEAVGWATGRASGLLKTGCWFVGGDD